jgi:hypothetical protein
MLLGFLPKLQGQKTACPVYMLIFWPATASPAKEAAQGAGFLDCARSLPIWRGMRSLLIYNYIERNLPFLDI